MQIREQLEAIGTALLMIEKLPAGTVWALTCTNDDDTDSTSVLNIYIASENWNNFRAFLRLENLVDRDETFVSYHKDALTVSFIEE